LSIIAPEGKLIHQSISRRTFLTQAVRAATGFPLAVLCGGAARSARFLHENILRSSQRQRLRELGIIIGELPTGKWNAITDVPGVKVGHCTRIEGEGELITGRGPIRTGVTVILPNEDIFHENLTAARFVLNGNGEMTGLGSVDQRGLLQSPIFLTDTSNVGRVMNGALTWFLQTYPEIGDAVPVPVPVVAETWAGFLHDMVGRHLHEKHVLAALDDAKSGPVPEGAVGGGVGMVCYDFKGGIGTTSRVLPAIHGGYTIGVLVQTNHGDREQLMINGVPVGKEIRDLQPIEERKTKSILLIGATDAPMIPSQLQRLCKRMAFGLARTGAISSHGSGDLLLFFSTGVKVKRSDFPLEKNTRNVGVMTEIEIFNDEWMTKAHQAAMEAAEESILNSLCMAATMTGINGNTVYALPIERLPTIMKKYGR
jgi:D-aminopeptidase